MLNIKHSANGCSVVVPNLVVDIDYGYSCVDKTTFSPNIDDVRNFLASGSSGSSTPYYDYKDGVDDGTDFTQLRNKSADVTEIEVSKTRLTDEVNEAVDDFVTDSTYNQVVDSVNSSTLE